MPLYEFQADDGERMDIFFEMGRAPRIGETIEVDGKSFTRLFSNCLLSVSIANTTHGYPYVSNRLPHTVDGVKKVRHGGRLKPLIQSRRQERELMARYDLTKDAASNEDT